VASQVGGFDAIIADSAPCDLVKYYDEDPAATAHIMGGAPFNEDGSPSQVYERYLAHSCNTLVSEGGFRVPLYLAYNAQDVLVPDEHAKNLSEALAGAYALGGVRYGVHDFDHPAPGDTHHVQTRMVSKPMGYTTEAMLRFLEGAEVRWQEAEDPCEDCAAGEIVFSTADRPLIDMSKAGGRHAVAAGRVFSAAPPSDIPAGKEVTATAVLVLEGKDDLDAATAVATIRYTEGENVQEKVLLASDFASEMAKPMFSGPMMVSQYQSTRLVFTPADPSTGVLTIDAAGVGTLLVDAVITTWEP
jgi:hypothetical protein